MAEGKREHITFQDVHHTRSFYKRFISSLSEEISKIVICSPYFDGLPSPFKDIIDFCNFLQRRGVENIQIITRPPGADKTAMTLDTAKHLSANGVEITIRTSPYLHAKFYHIEYAKGYFRSFVGSANFTIGGLSRNHELIAEMEGVGIKTACHREIAKLVDIGGLTYQSWVARALPKGEEETK